jgi:hypothetical protein
MVWVGLWRGDDVGLGGSVANTGPVAGDWSRLVQLPGIPTLVQLPGWSSCQRLHSFRQHMPLLCAFLYFAPLAGFNDSDQGNKGNIGASRVWGHCSGGFSRFLPCYAAGRVMLRAQATSAVLSRRAGAHAAGRKCGLL